MSMSRKIAAVAAVLFCLARPIFAGEAPLQPGRYESEFGHLLLEQLPDQSLNFEITVVGRTQDICALNGQIVGNKARLDRHCLLRFYSQNRSIQVRSEGTSCNANCGAGATFAGSYELPIEGCDANARAQTRANAQQLYADQNYRAAYAQLEPMLARCAAHLAWLERIELSNDLANTHYQLGDLAACKSTLAPWRIDSALTDVVLAQQWGVDSPYPPLIASVRTTLALCEAASTSTLPVGISKILIGIDSIQLSHDQHAEGLDLIPGNDGFSAGVITLVVKVGEYFNITDRQHLGTTYRLWRIENGCAVLEETIWTAFPGRAASIGASTRRICMP